MSDLQRILQAYKLSKERKENDLDSVDKKRKTSHPSIIDENYGIQDSTLTIPHFLILGAQKAGTMAAVKNLNKHPQINCLSEVHFFDLGWHSRDRQWYNTQFSSSTKSIQGEKTPELIYMDECAIRIKETCPDTKFILFIREPIARAYSSWNMNKNKNRETLPFEESIQRNIDNLNEIRSYGTGEYHYVQRGMYMDQIQRFHSVFPDRNKLLVVIAERIHNHPAEEYSRIFKFLGAESYKFLAEDEHIGTYSSSMNLKVEDKLRKFYKSHNERLYQYLGYRIHEWEYELNSLPITSPLSEERLGNNILKSSKTEEIVTTKDVTLISNGSTALTTAVEDPPELQLPCVKENGNFAKFGRKHGTDKITHHGYHRFYPRFIEHYRSMSNSAMLEIGVDRSNSLNMWLEYFPFAFIYGIDISLASKGERFEIFKADQSQQSAMQSITEEKIKHPLFLIVDDGSHIPEHQIQCFNYLFNKALQPGGTYIVEDIETSYWTRNGLYGYTTRYGYHHERSAIEVFKDALDDINNEFLTDENKITQERRVGRDVSFETRQQISSVTFGQNCIIIMKKSNEEYQYDNRIYRFKKNL